MARSTKFGPDLDPNAPKTAEQSPGGFFDEGGPGEVAAARSSAANAEDAREYAEDSRGWAVGTTTDALDGWSDTNNSRYYALEADSDARAAAAAIATVTAIEQRIIRDSEEIQRNVDRVDSELVEIDSDLIAARAIFARIDSEAVRVDSDVVVAEAAAQAAEASATAAAGSASAAAMSASQAATSATNAANSATAAASSASAAAGSASAAAASAASADSERVLAEAAARSADSERVLAEAARDEADSEAVRAKSWAVGPSGTGTDGTDTNNARYWAEVAQSLVDSDSDTTYQFSWDEASRNLTIRREPGDSDNVIHIPLGDDSDTRYTAGGGLELDDTEFVIANLGVTAAKIANGAVGTAGLANGAVTTIKIADNAVDTDKLGPQAVTTAKIAGGAVTHDQIGAGAISQSKLQEGNGSLGLGTVGQVLTSNGINGFQWTTPTEELDTTYEFAWNESTRNLTITREPGDSENVINIGGGSTPTPVEHASVSLSPNNNFNIDDATTTTVTATFAVGSGFTFVGTGNSNGNAGNDTVTVNRGTVAHSTLTGTTATWTIDSEAKDTAGTLTLSAVVYARDSSNTLYHQTVSASLRVNTPWYFLRADTAPANVAAMTSRGAWTSPQTLTPTGTGSTLYVALPRRSGSLGYDMRDGDLRLFNPADKPATAFDTHWSLYSTTEAVNGVAYTIREV